MPESTVTSKGQITIPVEVRRRLGLEPGSRIRFVATDSDSYEIVRISGTIRSLKGLVPSPASPVTLADMDRAIAEQVAAEFRT
jgi:antitoxin PrlF